MAAIIAAITAVIWIQIQYFVKGYVLSMTKDISDDMERNTNFNL